MRYLGESYAGGAEAWWAIVRRCSAATAAAAADRARTGATLFYDHVGYLARLAVPHVAILREPKAWAASHYYFLRDEPPPAGAGSNLSLADALRENHPYLGFFARLRNAQARYLCGAGVGCDVAFAQTPIELIGRFAVVGLLEDFDATFRALERELPGTFAGVYDAWRKRAPGAAARPQLGDAVRPRGEVLPPEADARLGELFAEDLALYAAAAARLADAG